MTLLEQANFTFAASPAFAYAAHFIFCACLGSYFNLFAWRWPQIQERQWLADMASWFHDKGWPAPQPGVDLNAPKLGLALPPSFCPHCKTPIALRHNIPVLGWLALRGKAACCGQRIAPTYPIYELFCGLLGVFAWSHYGEVAAAWTFLALAMPLCMAAQTDFESMMLPDSITGFTLFFGLGLAAFGWAKLSPALAFSGMAAGYLALEAIRLGGSFLLRKEAMGQGDPKFLAAIGAWIGPWALPQTLLVASTAALIYAVGSIALRKGGRAAPFPFGPFLALGGVFSYVWPQALASWLGQTL
jgi:leader peptidase (prepilin peptidase)/N-methyltransferase